MARNHLKNPHSYRIVPISGFGRAVSPRPPKRARAGPIPSWISTLINQRPSLGPVINLESPHNRFFSKLAVLLGLAVSYEWSR